MTKLLDDFLKLVDKIDWEKKHAPKKRAERLRKRRERKWAKSR